MWDIIVITHTIYNYPYVQTFAKTSGAKSFAYIPVKYYELLNLNNGST